MRRLNHPNIVKILDILEPEAGTPPADTHAIPGDAFKKLYVVLEDGGMDLQAFIAQQYAPLATEVIQSISRQICAALSYLHSCRVVHRDLKPANILIDPQTFHVRIADFGLSRAVELPADAALPAPPTPPSPPSHLGIRKSTSEANFFALCSSSEFRTVAGEDGPHACVQMGVEHLTLDNDFQTVGASALLASPLPPPPRVPVGNAEARDVRHVTCDM
jgi:serine/threonine protein kinase